MCSIFGFVGPSLPTDGSLDLLRQAASDRGRDGGRVETYSLQNGLVAWLGNWRAAPTPEVERGPLQPYDGLVHNGCIANDKELGGLPGEIDSQVLARVLNRSNAQSLVASLQQVHGSYALACHNGRTVFLACNYKPIHYYSPDGVSFYFSSMARHFAGLLPRGRYPVQLTPYSVLDLLTGECLPLPRQQTQRAVVVCSAGLDSTTAAYLLKSQGWDIALLHFLYGCKAEGRERARIESLAKHLGAQAAFLQVPYSSMEGTSTLLTDDDRIGDTVAGAEYAIDWVPARNVVFAALAVAYAEANGYHAIALGTNLEESLPYEEKVLVKQEGQIRSIPIGELYEQGQPTDLKVLGLKQDGTVIETSVSKVIRHKCSYDHLLRIEDSWGRTVTVTPCHSIITYRDGRFCAADASELRAGDYVLTPRKFFEGKQKNLSVPLDYFPSSAILSEDGRSVRSKTRSSWLPLHLEIDQLWAEFFGYWIGDGCYDSHSIVLSLGLDGKELIARLIRPISQRLGVNYQMTANGDTWINRAMLKYAMQGLGFTGKTYTKKIPSWIYNLPRREQAAFLRGYFSADGSASKRRLVEVSSVNVGLLEATQTLLLMQGIPSKRCTAAVDTLQITDTKDLKQFAKRIGFLLARKQDRLLHMQESKHSRAGSDGLPWGNQIEKCFARNKRIIGYAPRPILHQAVPRRLVEYFLGRTKTSRIGSMVKRSKVEELARVTGDEQLQQLATSEVYFTPIRKITKVAAPDWVYDLSVPETENFALANGIFVHNSGAFPDNEEQFTYLLNRAAPYCTQEGYAMEVLSPVGHLMKHEIVKLGLQLGVPYELTWSCYRGGESHCGHCGPCFMRKTAFARNGASDPVFIMPIEKQVS